MVNSNGQEGEANCWGKRANWVDMFGEVEGEKLGVAILDHPTNPGHPTYWHVRGYGFFAANIFGMRAFERNPATERLTHARTRRDIPFPVPGCWCTRATIKTANIAALYDTYSAMK